MSSCGENQYSHFPWSNLTTITAKILRNVNESPSKKFCFISLPLGEILGGTDDDSYSMSKHIDTGWKWKDATAIWTMKLFGEILQYLTNCDILLYGQTINYINITYVTCIIFTFDWKYFAIFTVIFKRNLITNCRIIWKLHFSY